MKHMRFRVWWSF